MKFTNIVAFILPLLTAGAARGRVLCEDDPNLGEELVGHCQAFFANGCSLDTETYANVENLNEDCAALFDMFLLEGGDPDHLVPDNGSRKLRGVSDCCEGLQGQKFGWCNSFHAVGKQSSKDKISAKYFEKFGEYIPCSVPTSSPSEAPSPLPSAHPSASAFPSASPSEAPSKSAAPSGAPTASSSQAPSASSTEDVYRVEDGYRVLNEICIVADEGGTLGDSQVRAACAAEPNIRCCEGHDACYNFDDDVVKMCHNSCIGNAACEFFGGDSVGAGSCIGDRACDGVQGNVGVGSCNGYLACAFNPGSVGDGSCNGDYTCCLC